MHRHAWIICVLAVGCGTPSSEPAEASAAPPASPVVRGKAPEDDATTVLDQAAVAVDDLRTRKTGADWPGFLGPTGNSVSSEQGIVAPWPREGLRLVWQTPVATGYGMPSLGKGRLFHFDRVGDRARLSCLKSETGEPLWRFQYPTDYTDDYGYNNGPRCSPVLDGDRVYCYGAEGMLHCLNVRTGRLLWRVDTRAEFGVVQNFFGVGSTPVIDGDLLIAQVGGSPPGEKRALGQKGNGSGIVAFDKLTGKVRYQTSNELASYAGLTLATLHQRRKCFVFARGGLLGLDAASGKIDFHFPWRAKVLESVNAACPVVVGEQVFISETYGPGSALLKIKENGYDVLWTDADKRFDKSLQCHWNTPIHHAGYVYGSSGRHSQEAQLRCIELATGKVMWTKPGLDRASLLMVDGHFICMSEHGILRLLKVSPEKYVEVAQLELRNANSEKLLHYPCWEAPILAHGLLYIRGKDRLLCLELIPLKK